MSATQHGWHAQIIEVSCRNCTGYCITYADGRRYKWLNCLEKRNAFAVLRHSTWQRSPNGRRMGRSRCWWWRCWSYCQGWLLAITTINSMDMGLPWTMWIWRPPMSWTSPIALRKLLAGETWDGKVKKLKTLLALVKWKVPTLRRWWSTRTTWRRSLSLVVAPGTLSAAVWDGLEPSTGGLEPLLRGFGTLR